MMLMRMMMMMMRIWRAKEVKIALHSSFSSIFTRFEDIAAFVLQLATSSPPHF